MLEGIAGVQWDSCCLAARLVARRYVLNRTGEMNDAIRLEIELKGLGSAGPDTEGRLRRAILGYYREDLDLEPEDTLGAAAALAALERAGNDLPAPYLRALFDQYADDFDRNLIDDLGYRAPQ